MTPTVYLHIGTPKTATTTIQNFLAKNRKLLKTKGVLYPTFSNAPFENSQKSRNGRFLVAKVFDPEFADQCLDKIIKKSKKFDKIILSDEGIWNMGATNRKLWGMLDEKFAKNGIHLKVVVYLRRQDLYAYSYWAERVKSTSYLYLNLNEFLYASGAYRDYGTVLETIASCIGRENIIVRPFEKGHFQGAGNDMISDFFDAVGVELTDEFASLEREDNDSLKDSVLEAKKILNRVSPYRRKGHSMRSLFVRAQSEMQEEGLLRNRTQFTTESREKYIEKFAGTNAMIARNYLGRSNGVLFAEATPKQEEEWAFEIDEIREVYGRVLKLTETMPCAYSPSEAEAFFRKALRYYDKDLSSYRMGTTLLSRTKIHFFSKYTERSQGVSEAYGQS